MKKLPLRDAIKKFEDGNKIVIVAFNQSPYSTSSRVFSKNSTYNSLDDAKKEYFTQLPNYKRIVYYINN